MVVKLLATTEELITKLGFANKKISELVSKVNNYASIASKNEKTVL
jgi:hypothetical protein